MNASRIENLLEAILEVSQGGAGTTPDVNIVSTTPQLAQDVTVQGLATQLSNVVTQLTAINGNTDLLETLQNNANVLLTLSNQYVDNIEALLGVLNGNTDSLEALLTQLGLNTDTLESLISAGNTLLTNIINNQTNNSQSTRITDGTDNLNINPDGSINTNISGLNTLATLAEQQSQTTSLNSISGKLPTTLGKKNAIQSLSVTLDSGYTSTTGGYYRVRTAGTISGVTFNVNDRVYIYNTDFSTGGLLLSYIINLTTGLNTPSVSLTNTQLALFENDSVIPSNLVRETIPFSIENNTFNTSTYTSGILNLLNTYYLDQTAKRLLVEQASLCVIKKVVDSPLVGDVTYYKGYNNNDYIGNGNPTLVGATFTIERIIVTSSGEVFKSWADNKRNDYSLIFDDGTQNYLTYIYF